MKIPNWKIYCQPVFWHAAANAFALLSDGSLEFRALVDDIKKEGLNNPIALYEGKVLDGRNRVRACESAQVEPDFFVWAPKIGQTAESWSASQNIVRRHLGADQQKLGEAELHIRSYTQISRLRAEYSDLSEEFSARYEKVKNGEISLAVLVRELDRIQSGDEVNEVSLTVGGAAQTFLRFLSYEIARPAYDQRLESIAQLDFPKFEEAWRIVQEAIYGASRL